MDKTLSEVRALDFTDALAGPYCTRYMADCGAEVINIEKPGGKMARADVAALLQSYLIQSAPVLSAGQLIDEDEQFKLRDILKELEDPVLGKVKFLISPLRYTNSNASVDVPPTAAAGESTDEVLKSALNMKDDELAALKKEGIIFDGK